MAVFKVVISDPKSRKTFQTDVDQSKAVGLIGKRIGDQFNGDILGLEGYGLEITGGTDQDGFPMHPGLKGSGRTKMLLTERPGFKPDEKGQRKRKTVRGNTISDSIVQINVKVVKSGERPFEEFMKGEEEEKPEEQAEEEAKEGKAEEKPEKKEEKEEEKEGKDEKPAEESKPKEEPKKEEPEEKPEEESGSEEKDVKDEEKGEEKEGEEVNKEK